MQGLKFNMDFNYDSYNYKPFSSARGYDNFANLKAKSECEDAIIQFCKLIDSI